MGSLVGAEPSSTVPKPWRTTPLIESSALSRAVGCHVLLKLENLQPSGSFKSRAIGNLMRQHLLSSPQASAAGGNTHFYSSSGGNAGLAAATAAFTLGQPCTVVVPTSTSQLMISRIKTAGATAVIQHGDSWREADTHLQGVVMVEERTRGKDTVYVPPFDHPNVWNGNATLIEELPDRPDAVVCSVGGGGLFCGVQIGLQRRGWADVPVLAVETEGAASLRAALDAGELSTLAEIKTIATSLGAKTVAQRALDLAQKENVKSVVLSDAEAAMGSWRLADDERVMVEPACGVNVALCYDGRLKELLPNLNAESRVVIVLCGGSNITLDKLLEYRKTYGASEEDVQTDPDIPSSVVASKNRLKVGLGGKRDSWIAKNLKGETSVQS